MDQILFKFGRNTDGNIKDKAYDVNIIKIFT